MRLADKVAIVTGGETGIGAAMPRRVTPLLASRQLDVVAPPLNAVHFDARTRALLEGPIVSTLLRLATPNVFVMFVQASVGLIETYFVAKLGTDALAGVALVFPVLMLMQMMSAGAMGGGISSAIARALGAGRRTDANALVLHALPSPSVSGSSSCSPCWGAVDGSTVRWAGAARPSPWRSLTPMCCSRARS